MKLFLLTERYKRFRALLVAARRDAGITQVELAKRLRVPQSFVSKYEIGERRLDVVEFLFVAEVLGIDPRQIIGSLLVSSASPATSSPRQPLRRQR